MICRTHENHQTTHFLSHPDGVTSQLRLDVDSQRIPGEE